MTRFILKFFLLLICAVPALVHAHEVVINELMYDSASHSTNQEWIELHNTGPVGVPLLGWKFTKGIDLTFSYPVNIPAGGYLIVAADPVWFGANYPSVEDVVGGWAGTLANGGETLRLEDAGGNKVDEVTYASEGDWGQRIQVQSVGHFGWDWAALHAGTGKSVEVINPNLLRDSGQNWAASVTDGGTPGLANSVFTTNSPALILETAHLPLVPRATNSVIVSARIMNPTGGNMVVTLFYRVDANPQSNPFTAVGMLDNGLSGDGVANDGVYAVVLPPRANGTIIEYYVRAVTSTGVTNTWPARANVNGTLTQSANALYQVDDSTYVGGQPIYRLIMTETERSTLAQIVSSDAQSDAQMNTTLISMDGFSTELRHRNGVRIRGAGSRGVTPPNLRLDIPRDQRWKGISQINLNTQFTHSQLAGYALASRAGLDTEAARAVQVRVNGLNQASATSPQFGSYIALEAPNGDFVDEHYPQDNGGNLYRASTGSHSANLAYLGTNVSSYTSSGYSKQNNTTENDWSDLFNLTFALSANTPDSNYVAAVRQNVNVEQWMLYFALFTMTESEETSLGTGFGDDFGMYRGLNDPRFRLLAHDWDTILQQGQGTFSVTRNIFRAANVASIARFIRHQAFAPIYYGTLQRLLDTTFSNAEESRTLDEVLGSWVPASTISVMKTFATNRNAYVQSQIFRQLTVQAALPVSGGYPQTTGPTVALNGFSDVINTRTILVNGATSTWSAWEGRWTNNNVTVQPGLTRVFVQALGSSGLEIARTNIDIWFDAPGTAVSGSIASSTSWTAENAPYNISGTLGIAAGATLTIEPGVSVHLGAGAAISVANGGRLLAEGSPLAHIRFTRAPGTANAWSGLTINGAPGSLETRIAYADFEFNSGTAINVQGGEVYLDHLTFGATDRRYLNLDVASFIVSDCYFPATTASIEPIHGTGGIRPGGHGIFTRNYCGKVNGYNDTIDFTGGSRPGPIVQFLDNVFVGSDDDILDLDSTDAWVEGNIFLHAHRNGSPDSSSGVSGGNDNGQTSRITMIGNIFYDVDQAATAKQGNFYTFLNNTVVRQSGVGFGDSGAAAVLNFGDDGFVQANGMYAEGNIIVDAQRLTRYVTNGTALASNTTFHNNLMPFTWFGTGTNNSTNSPFLTYLPELAETTNFTTWESAQILRDWFRPRAGSPAIGSGPNGRDQGGVIALGASISGEPSAVTPTNAATLVVGVNRATPGWPNGSGYTAYKWRLDGGAWSAETSLVTPITLNGLANGSHRVEVSGLRDSGLYQDDPMFGSAALVTASRTWLVTNAPGKVLFNEILAGNVAAFLHEGETPDAVELFNPGSTVVNLGGKSMTDDPSNHTKFVFPPNTLLGPGEYLIVFADTSKVTSGLHLGFALSQAGESLYLYDSLANGGGLLDSITFGLQLDDRSIGRVTGGGWTLNYPTLGSANQIHPLGELAGLKINEWLADQTFGQDFVEVLNPGALPVDIGGSFFSDAPAGAPMLHRMPPLSFLAAGAYYALIADGDVEQGADHLGFKLSPEQGTIGWFSPGGALIDSVLYGPQTTDIAEGLSPNGSDTRASFVLPTPGAPNPFINAVITISNSVVNVFGVTSQPWRYESSGTDFGTDWLVPAFDDSGWPTGQGLFGFETTPAIYPFPFNTTVPAPSQGGPITAYYRTHFQWTNGPGWQLFSTNYVDDGAVYYLNGVEVGRVRMAASPVLFSSTAQSRTGEGAAEVFTLSATTLVPGDNVLQVEVHQSDSGSSDDVFGMALTAVRSTTNVVTTTIALNEVMANNRSFTNTDGTITDWVEIFNPSANAIDLSDMSLTDDVALPRRWVFPAGISLPSLGYLTVKFDSQSPATTNAGPSLNTGFGFDAGGDKVLLFNKPASGGAVLDSIQFGLQAADFTVGRIPNGFGSWALTLPTEGGLNIAAALGSVTSLRVNEWMADPKSGEDYFEIHNPNNQPVALAGLYLTDNLNDRTQYRIPSLSFIGVSVRGFVEFIADSAPGKGADHTNFKLSAGGESIGLFATDGLTLIDAVTFGAQQKGVSEGRFPDGNTNVVRFPETPTPGQANFLPFNDVVINEALSHTDPPLEDAIELFNPTALPVNIGGWYLSDSQLQPRKYRIPANTILQPGGFAVFYEYQFNPTLLFPSFSLSSANGDEIFLSVTDTNGNLTGYRTSADFGAQVNGVSFGRFETSIGFDFVSMTARTLGVDGAAATVEEFRGGLGKTNVNPIVGPIVISEIQYHPPDLGTNDNTRDEFIELQNFSASAVPLFDPANPTNTWHLRGAIDFDFATNSAIPAGGFLVIVGFNPATNAPALAAFRAVYGIGAEVVIVGPFSGKLNNGDDEVRLNFPDAPNNGDAPYVLAERIHYRDNTPWPSAADGNTNGPGISLQRIVPQNYGNDPVNWIAGVPTPGGASGAAVLTPPTITLQPASRAVVAGTPVTFVMTATGAAPLLYQWRFNGLDLANATNASFSVASAQAMNAGAYSVRVVNPAGAALSATALLVLQAAPQVVFQPQGRTVAVGANTSFSVGASGTAPLSYQWRKDGATIDGATQPLLLLTNVQNGNAGNYSVVITNTFGSITSAVALLQLSVAPQVVAQPTNQTVIIGQTVTLSVGVTGSTPLSYQWLFNGGVLSGATSSNLVFTNVQPSRAGIYSVIVTNLVGAAFSSNATLAVIVPPTVTVSASDPNASEAGPDPGTFTITRNGSNSFNLTVFFNLGGSAGAGDYQAIPLSAVIPANLNSVTVPVLPIDDAILESSETVTLMLVPAAAYILGSPTNATVTIADNDNLAPAVVITTPTNNTFVPTTPTNLLLAASAADPNPGQSASLLVNYYFGTNRVGSASGPSFEVTWTNIPSGSNLLVAVATDSFGLSTTSAPVALSINGPPLVFITSPTNGAAVAGPANVLITASATDTNGGVAQVDFYVGGALLGSSLTAPYSVNLPNAPLGAYQAFAVARDGLGLVSTSAVVNFTVAIANTNLTDAFDNRGVLNGFTNFLTANNNTTTLEGNEPNHYFGHAVKTMWLQWTAPGSGQVAMDTINSAFDTILAVYTNQPGVGVSFGSLVPVAVNDDDVGLQSRVQFTAFYGTVYYIAVAGYDTATPNSGAVQFHLGLTGPPTITSHPLSQTRDVGTSATFNVGAASGSTLSYQWRFNGGNLAGATTASLLLTNVQAGNAGSYDVRVSNTSGSVTSLVAVLTIRPGTASPPVMVAPRVTNGVFTAVLAAGATNRSYQIELSVNLTNWVQFLTLSNVNGPVSFTDTNVPPLGTLRAYRARVLP